MKIKENKIQQAETTNMASPGDVLEEAINNERSKRNWVHFLIEIGIAVALVVLIFNTVIGISKVSGDSMAPAFYSNKDRVVFFRLGNTYKKGDVVVFETKSGEQLILRVTAVQGETVYIDPKDKKLYINGQVVQESNIYTKTEVTDSKVEYPLTITKNHVFLLGDNRQQAKDSRNSEIGQVSEDQILGKVFFQFRSVK